MTGFVGDKSVDGTVVQDSLDVYYAYIPANSVVEVVAHDHSSTNSIAFAVYNSQAQLLGYITLNSMVTVREPSAATTILCPQE